MPRPAKNFVDEKSGLDKPYFDKNGAIWLKSGSDKRRVNSKEELRRLFAEQPELVKPQFVVKAIRYPGNDIHSSTYLDTDEFFGPLSKQFEGALGFIKRNLAKIQGVGGVNSPGTLEIGV